VCPTVCITSDEEVYRVTGRNRGLLTGSGSAPLLSCLPIIDVLIHCTPLIAAVGLPLDIDNYAELTEAVVADSDCATVLFPVVVDKQYHLLPEPVEGSRKFLGLAAWADNLFVFGVRPHAAVLLLDAAECRLQARFGLALKAGSVEIMLGPKSAVIPVVPDTWKIVESMVALGHVFHTLNDCAPCIARTLGQCWAATWRNHGSCTKLVGLHRRGALFNRAVGPVLSYHCPRWLYTASAAKMVAAQEVKMASTIIRFRVNRSLSWSDNWTARMTLLDDAKVLEWDEMWRRCSIRWHQHLDRHPALLPARMRRLVVAQARVNDERRCRMALRGNDRALGVRRVLGRPKRMLQSIMNLEKDDFADERTGQNRPGYKFGADAKNLEKDFAAGLQVRA
jgi:hypothetical protein